VFRSLSVLLVALTLTASAVAGEPIRLASNPALSPDGKLLAFDYLGDIWIVPTTGGVARPLTRHPAKDTQPKFSPDGREIAFVSDRDGTPQVYTMPVTGGTPRQITFHTAGFTLHEWAPDGDHVLVSSQRDHAWSRRQPERFFLVNVRERKGEQLLFDDYGTSGTLSPDGKKLLFTREGPEWWRKGYTGAQASQIWLYDLDRKEFTCILRDNTDHRWPLWKPDGKGLYLATNRKNGFVLQDLSLDSKPLTPHDVASFPDDSIVFPCIARDGSTLVFRHLFDFYRLSPGGKPEKIDIVRDDDRAGDRVERRTLERATAVSFTSDGLEIAFIAGGDLWVMDTELREPRRVTATPEEERWPLFAPDGQSILFVSDAGGQTDIWRATRTDDKKPWWLNSTFKLEKVTTDGEAKMYLSFSPDGKKLAYVRGKGDLWIADADGKNAKRLIESWNVPSYDWSPDAKWIVYAISDNDFNRDIWVRPIDGSRPPFNVSRHPYNEDDPVWSPDGRMIAFIGARDSKETTDIHFVYLRAEDDQKNSRDRSIEKALEKIQKGRPTKTDPAEPAPKEEPKAAPVPPKKGPPEVVIDFDGIHERIRRVRIPNSNETNLLWSPDSKKLAFTATVDGQAGTYTIEIPDNLKPALLSTQTGTQGRWLKNNQIVWLSGGLPGSTSGTGSPATPTPLVTPTTQPPRGPRSGGAPGAASASAPGSYRFTAYQEIDLPKKHQAAFEMCWRTMRDHWYDERLGNRDWNAVRAKLLPVAETTDPETLTTVVQLMLGELNGSHLGFLAGAAGRLPAAPGTPPDEPADGKWRIVTPNLGVRFDEAYRGPGLKIRDVLPDGPAAQKRSELHPGEIIVSIDGKPVSLAQDLTEVLNGPQARDIVLKVKDVEGKEREVTIRPISYLSARTLVYRKWLADNRAMVEKLSNGQLGYLHIRAMDMLSFHEFQEELYNAGAGKEGLVIDVRENGGGSTTDHLLTALTQPRHAITVPRGGVQGYPQDRTVYATWNKPIVVLCNQNSFSNAEIFSHAIKTLKRGQLVGVPTAGAVISTGAASIMDVGTLRLPTRGWYLLGDGQDMELNGAVPNHLVWPQPGDLPRGKDDQIAKAVEVLVADVKEWKARPQPPLKKATER
jgi:tricorn protease